MAGVKEAREQRDLGVGGVLIFIKQHRPEPLAFPRPNLRIMANESRDQRDLIREIKQVVCSFPRDIAFDNWDEIGALPPAVPQLDRKSTRLNSSHVAISYAVFCLK